MIKTKNVILTLLAGARLDKSVNNYYKRDNSENAIDL